MTNAIIYAIDWATIAFSIFVLFGNTIPALAALAPLVYWACRIYIDVVKPYMEKRRNAKR